MKVCIAEKPSVAKEIAKVIGADQKKDGYFEGNGYQVTWTFGHFCTLLAPQDYKPHWKRWDLNSLPMLPDRFETKVMDDSGVKRQFKVIEGLFKNASEVINCGDAGQEGELIQRWVIQKAGFKGEVKRLWISSLTTEAIEEGFKDLRPEKEFDTLYYAGSSRAIGDWLLGINATRLFTLKYGVQKQVLSIGRVQTPTLAMLVDRHYEIENFKPEPYWELQTTYRDTVFNSTEGRFTKKEDGEKLLEAMADAELEVVDVSKKEGKEYAPKLFDLTAVQVYCNNKFGFTAESTLKLVQTLYEKKLVSYPRVDTVFLPNDLYPKVPKILSGLSNYGEFTAPILGKKIRKSTKVFNDKKVTDHHAIIPTGEQGHMSTDEAKVYDIITRRFIAVFHPDCTVSKTEVQAKVAEVPFVAKGKEIITPGWRVCFPKDENKASKTEDDNILPTFVKGEMGPHTPSFLEKTTKPPNYYTEASLLRAMETAGKQVDDDELRDLMKANGIGRPSTRANIIETLFKRKYTVRNKKQVLPTEMGIQLIDTIQNQLLKSAELTGLWEKQLKEIEDGEYSAKQFIANMKKMVDDLVMEVRLEKNATRLGTAAQTAVPSATKEKANKSSSMGCPKCKEGQVLKGKSSYGCSAWKAGCDFRLPFVFLDKKLSDKQVERLIEKGSTTKLKGFVQAGSKVDGKVILGDDFLLKLEADAPKKAPSNQESSMPACPKCKKGTLIKGKSAYGCSAWKSGCDFRFSFEDIKQKAAGQQLTKELVLAIISA
ncbi:MAG: DNA topoisomerase 3 [Flavobacteriales bacterium]|nr:DNA topoisomerase 3 [Flavobacteriales bacterium]MDP4952472.1 DNA topoisomerase 3 [Flavobacteriales bacterium]